MASLNRRSFALSAAAFAGGLVPVAPRSSLAHRIASFSSTSSGFQTQNPATPPSGAELATERQYLAVPGNIPGTANGINDAGQIVGWTGDIPSAYTGMLWDGDTSLELASPEGGTFQPFAINEDGFVVGKRWVNDDLGDLVSWYGDDTFDTYDLRTAIVEPIAVNDNGEIVTNVRLGRNTLMPVRVTSDRESVPIFAMMNIENVAQALVHEI